MLRETFNFSAEDCAFIENISERFPFIRENFMGAAAVSPEGRLSWAFDRVEQVKRKGYVIHGVEEENTQSVWDHILGMVRLNSQHCPLHISVHHASALSIVHDLPEAIATDFTPHDDITAGEKSRLEDLAARVLFENEDPQWQTNWEEYKQKQTPAAKWVKELDKLELLEQTLVYMESHPHLQDRMLEFWRSGPKGIQTAEGQKIYSQLADRKEKLAPGL